MNYPTVQHGAKARGPELQIIHNAEGLLVASFGPVLVSAWAAKPIPRLFEIQRMQLAAAVARNPGKQMFMCVVAPNADPPDQTERDASAKMITAHGDKLAACACVIEGSGFRAAITRTVLTGIVLVIRTRSPVTFFESMESASLWLQKRTDGVSLSSLAEKVAAVRAQARV